MVYLMVVTFSVCVNFETNYQILLHLQRVIFSNESKFHINLAVRAEFNSNDKFTIQLTEV